MRILYDYQAFELQRVGGISRYFSILIKSLPQYGIDTVLPILGTENMYMKERCRVRLPLKSPDRKNKKISKFLIPLFKHDLLHPTYYNPYILKCRQPHVPMVITVHDLIHELFPSYFADARQVQENKKRVCHEADRLIAISENTKRDMMDIWGIEESRIDVVHHGLMWDDTLLPQSIELPFTGDYILFVGDRSARYKNFAEFVSGVAPVLKRYGLFLVCTGYPFTGDEYNMLRNEGIENCTITLMATESQLLWLYENATCFVFPSQYEGFGIPILEAFKSQCPTLLSRASCFPEIAADAAEYYEVGHSESLTAALSDILDDSQKRADMKSRGVERLKFFPIEKMVNLTVDVYRKTIG